MLSILKIKETGACKKVWHLSFLLIWEVELDRTSEPFRPFESMMKGTLKFQTTYLKGCEKMKTGKKLASLAVSALMVLSMCIAGIGSASAEPVSGEAKIGSTVYETLTGDEGALAKANEGDTITLLKNVESTGSISIEKDITLDLDGNTLSLAGTYSKVNVYAGHRATIQGGTVVSQNSQGMAVSGDLTVTGCTITAFDNAINVSSGGSLTVKNSKLKTTGKGYYTVQSSSAEKVTLENCIVSYEGSASYHNTLNLAAKNITVKNSALTSGKDNYGTVRLKVTDAEGNATLTGNTITNTSAQNNNAVDIAYDSLGAIILGSGNTVNGPVKLLGPSPAYSVVFAGGYFASETPVLFANEGVSYDLSITGGFYKNDSVSGKVAAGYFMVENSGADAADYPYTVIGNSAAMGSVAYIPKTGSFYKTLDEALTAADGNTVELLSDVSAESLAGNIDGKGKTITFSGGLSQLLATRAELRNAKVICSDGSVLGFSMKYGALTGGIVEASLIDIALSNLADGYLMEYDSNTIKPESAFEARIGKFGYPLLPNAISVAVQNDSADNQVNDTVVMLKDKGGFVESMPYACYTLDLNGHTLGTAGDEYGYVISPAAVFTPDSAKITLTDSKKTGKIIGRDFGVATNGNVKGITLTLRGVTVVANEDKSAALGGMGVYFPSDYSVLNVIDSSITGDCGIGVKGGTVNISGSTAVTAVGEKKTPSAALGGGINVTGDAVYVEGGYNRPVTVNIMGGTFKSANAQAVNMLFTESTAVEETIAITGGTFSTDIKAYLATGYETDEGADGYQVGPKTTQPSLPSFTTPDGTTVKVDDSAKQVLKETAKDAVTSLLNSNEVSEEVKRQIRDALSDEKDITVEPVIEEIPTADVSQGTKNAVALLAKNGTVLKYLDISMLLKVDGATLQRIDTLSDKIAVSITLDKALLKEGRTFYVVSVFDGAAQKLATTLNGGTLTFTADKFNTFAIVYEDSTSSTPGGTPETPPTTNPPSTTGDGGIAALAGVALLSGLTAAVVLKKKKGKKS